MEALANLGYYTHPWLAQQNHWVVNQDYKRVKLAFPKMNDVSGAAEAIKVSPSAFERWCDDKVMESIRPQKRNAFSIGPVVAYYLARQTEIRTARIVLTAKANGFSEEAIRERVREMYV